MSIQNTPSEPFQYARRMIFLGMVFVPLAPYLLAIIVSCLFFLSSFKENSYETMSQVARGHAKSIESFLQERVNDLEFILTSFSAQELAKPGMLDELLASLRQETGAYVDLGLVDASGRHIAYAGTYNLHDKNYKESQWFLETQKNGVHISDVFLGFRGVPHFVVAVEKKGPVPLILRATIDSDAFGKKVESTRIGKSGEAFLLNNEGRFQTRLDETINLLDMDPDWAAYKKQANEASSFSMESVTGTKYLCSTSPINHGQWLLIVRQEVNETFDDISRVGIYILAVTLLGGGLTVPLAIAVSRKIGRALKEADEVKDNLRDRLSRSVRLAELGEMTASFAHEINNPLQIMESEIAVMHMNLEDCFKDITPTDESLRPALEDNMDQLEQQIRRCSQVTRSILWFGRQDHVQDAEIHLGSLMKEVAAMVLKKAEMQSIDFQVAEEPETPTVRCDTGKLQQIFLNLLNNAIYAIVERHGQAGGCLKFTAGRHGNGWAKVQVQDNGTGIPKSVLANIYTPFFTTKPPRKGTGLGLAVCYGLIESMGGSIDLETKENEGTTFTILLPAC